MSYRDELEAAQARADAEADRADGLQRELDALKRPPAEAVTDEDTPAQKRIGRIVWGTTIAFVLIVVLAGYLFGRCYPADPDDGRIMAP